jgi:Na+/H+-dicarboxylate symporter
MIWTGSLSRVFVYLAVLCSVFASIQLLPSSRKVGGWVGRWVGYFEGFGDFISGPKYDF